jgi:peroxiredoxin
MGSVKKNSVLVLLLVLFTGCGGMMDDLNPSGKDERPPIQCGITGPGVCQTALDFTLSDTLGNSVTLSSELTSTALNGVVLYFTMWCPVCKGDMTNILIYEMPSFPNVRFFAVDYVSGTVANARAAQLNDGYPGTEFMVLVDTGQSILNSYKATMGTTVVVDKAGVVQMNEEYKNGTRLHSVLSGLQ